MESFPALIGWALSERLCPAGESRENGEAHSKRQENLITREVDLQAEYGVYVHLGPERRSSASDKLLRDGETGSEFVHWYGKVPRASNNCFPHDADESKLRERRIAALRKRHLVTWPCVLHVADTKEVTLLARTTRGSYGDLRAGEKGVASACKCY